MSALKPQRLRDAPPHVKQENHTTLGQLAEPISLKLVLVAASVAAGKEEAMGASVRAGLVAVVLSWGGPASAEQFLVSDARELEATAARARPGDVLLLASGQWRDAQLLFRARGEAAAPITLRAQEPGKVVLTGKSSLRLAGQHLVVSGLVFRDGWSPTGEVIAFRSKSDEVANDSRVTEVVIDRFNNPVRSESDNWVALYGRRNRFDHSHIVGKGNQGATLVVVRDAARGLDNHHRIDHNYFGPRPPLGSNGGETMRIGTSADSLSDSFTTVENNYFDRCDGEAEIISVKSGANVIRGNIFDRSQGTVTLRHGNGNRVERNVFLGGGKTGAGGVRVINRDQVVRENYMEGLRGSGFTSAITVMNGVPNSSINRYHQVVGARIERNSVIDSWHVHLNAGADDERSASPKDVRFARNLVAAGPGEAVFRVDGDASGVTFSGDVQSPAKDSATPAGVISRQVKLERSANGLLYPVGLNGVGAPSDLQPIAKADTGVRWYAKDDPRVAFDSGRIVEVGPGEDLAAAARNARPGDILSLARGKYAVAETVVVDKPLTFAGPGGWDAAEITFSRPTLFQIADGGSLKLKQLSISGRDAPDAVGNAVIRTPPGGLIAAYALVIEGARISDLQVNASFDVLATTKGGYAREIRIRDSLFEDISGAAFKLDAETDDLGLYGAEEVSIRGATFRNIGGEAISLYRGGTDESTFGPRLELRNSELANVGRGSRNRSGASVRLHGVQHAEIASLRLTDSAPLSVIHTVGEPITQIANLALAGTPPAELKELVAKGPFRIHSSARPLLPDAKP